MDRRREEYPSFSSTLLDVISRSIDERDDKTITDVPVRRKSATGLESNLFYMNSNTRGSSVSRYVAETMYGFTQRPRPIRTNISHYDECNCSYNSNTPEMNTYTSTCAGSEDLKPKAKTNTKSRAMKIYGYLKKAGKQPISPGSRLATFLHSLFSTTNTKRSKFPSPYNGGDDGDTVCTKRKAKSASMSSSSASSFSRACLSKTPSSSRGMVTTDLKRSVKFCSGNNVNVNEYSQPLGDRSSPLAVKIAKNLNKSTEKNRRIEEASMNILKSYQKKVGYVFDSIKNNVDYDDGEDEASSYASSDLFELDHLTAIGMDRCMQELPLYETTSVDANRAIANGLIV